MRDPSFATDGLRLHDGMGNPAGHKRGGEAGGYCGEISTMALV
jgi:hypothetical protein